MERLRNGMPFKTAYSPLFRFLNKLLGLDIDPLPSLVFNTIFYRKKGICQTRGVGIPTQNVRGQG